MKRGLKIGLVAAGSLVAFVAVVVCLALWLVFTPDRLTGIVNKAADKYLDCEMSVGEIDLTVFSTFPNVSLQLSDVVLVNPVDSIASDTVAEIRHCQATLDVKALLNEQTVVLRSLQLNGGWANLYTTAEGTANYMIFPTDTTAVEELPDTTTFVIPDIDIKEIDVRDMRVDYYDAMAGQKAVIEGLSMHVNGSLLGEQLQAALKASLRNISVTLEGDDAMSASMERVKLDMKGSMKNCDAKADVNLSVGLIDANMADMVAHVEQIEWTLRGRGQDGKWNATTELTTQPIAASMGGDSPMSAALPRVQFKADALWDGNDIQVAPSLVAPDLTVALGNEQMLDKADIQLRATLHTDTLLSRVELAQGLLALNEHEINLKGGVEMPDTSTIKGNVSFATNRCDITRLLALVPPSYRYLLEGIDIRGHAVLKGTGYASLTGDELKIGDVDATLAVHGIDLLYNDSIALQTPRTNINMVYNGKRDHVSGRLSSDALHVEMEGLADAQLRDVEGIFTMKQAMRMVDGYIDAKATLSMAELSAAMDTLGLYTQEATMDITLDAGKNSQMHFDAALRLDTLNAAMGSLLAVSTRNLSVEAHAAYDETGDNILSQWDPKLAVDVVAGDVASPMLTVPVAIPHIQFDYADGRFTINDSRILLGNSDFGLRGDVHSIDSFINKTGLLRADLDFWSDFTDVTQIMDLVSGLGTSETPEEEAEENTAAAAESSATAEDETFMVPMGVDVRLNTDIRTVNVNGFKFDDIGGHVTVKDGVLVLEEMGFTSDAARMQLTAMYKSPRKNHLFVGFDFHLLDIEIDELIHMVPDVDSIIPMLSAFDGEAEFHLAGETYLKSNYDLKLSTLRAAAAIEGKDLVVMDNETFSQISKYLMFEKGTRNVVDSISVELTVFKDEVDLYPFLVSMDDYQAVIGGRHNINENLDFNYHISLTSPLRLGLDIGGTLDDMRFKLVGCKYAQMYNPEKQNAVQARTLLLKKIISDSLKDNVKPQEKR